MTSKADLIKEVAQDLGYSQEDIKRAIQHFGGKASTKAEIHSCLLRWSGYELEYRNRQIGGYKGAITRKNKEINKLNNENSLLKTLLSAAKQVKSVSQRVGRRD